MSVRTVKDLSLGLCTPCPRPSADADLPVHTPVRVPARTPTYLCAPLSVSQRECRLTCAHPCRRPSADRRRGQLVTGRGRRVDRAGLRRSVGAGT